jgi:CheY-like chemotaxis protein
MVLPPLPAVPVNSYHGATARGQERSATLFRHWEIRPTRFDVLVAMDDLAPRRRLVLVEDDPDNLEALSIFLAEKYDVFAYPCPTDALNAIEEISPDVLVLDIGTAPIDGVDCLKRIRAIPAYRDIPAVAFTGFGGDVERQRFLAAGFQAVVVKPVADPRREFMAVIERVLESLGRTGARLRLGTRPAPLALDVATTRPASFPRGFGETDGPASARLGDEDTR